MRKITLIAATAAVFASGLLMPTAGAFAAGCLNRTLVPMSLSFDTIEGSYDKGAYDAELAKGNKCPTTEQSAPVSNNTPLNGKTRTTTQQQTAQQ